MTPRIGFVGLSHLGIVSGVATAAKGFAVVGYDPNQQLCTALTAGRPPVFEPDLPELLATHRARLHFTADPAALAECTVVYLSRDIPTDDAGRSDLGALNDLIAVIVPHLAPGTTLVVLSQVPPGFTRGLAPRLSRPDCTIFYQVETLVFGQAVARALQPERFIVGCPDPAAPLPADYAAVLGAFGCPILPMRYESAELTKIAINVCLVASIAAANTLAELCEAIGADWSEMVPALRLDRRIGPYAYLAAGLGIAGGNLERDLATVRAFAAAHGTDAGVVDAWLVNSRHRRDWALRRLHAEVIARVARPTIAVWGLAYKPDTASTKNSPSLALLQVLHPFTTRVYDPQAQLPEGGLAGVAQSATALDACRDADALVVMTPWQEFAAIDPAEVRATLAGRVVIDPYGVMDRRRCVDAGLTHFRLGVAGATADSISNPE